MNAIQNFAFDEQLVRVVEVDGEPWFVASDVARVLGHRDAATAIRSLNEDEKGTHNVRTPGGEQAATIITEPGVYRLVFTSRKPEAERFKRWLAHEVLPALRRTGTYSAPGVTPDRSAEFEGETLSARVAAVEAARRLYGRPAARALWARIGLPEIEGVSVQLTPLDDTDGRDCLAHLLAAEITLPDSGEVVTVRSAILGDIALRRVLPALGIIVDDAGIWVRNRSAFLDEVFRETRWRLGGWREALRALPGAHGRRSRNNRKFAGEASRATWVPNPALNLNG